MEMRSRVGLLVLSLLVGAAAFAIDESALDRTVDPCNDFYQFSCGNWIAAKTLPPGYSSWTRSFDDIQEENLNTLKTLLEQYAAGGAGAPVVTYGQKLGDYYSSCMDQASAEKATKEVLPGELAAIDAISCAGELPAALAALQVKGVDAFFSFSSDRDYGDVTRMIGIVDRGGMGLPDKDYYLSHDAAQLTLRQQYVDHIAKTLALTGLNKRDATKQAQAALAMETALAQNALALADRRDPARIYHPMDSAALAQLAPDFDWSAYFAASGVSLTRLSANEPDFIKGATALIKSSSLEDIRAYLKWEYLRMASPTLGKAFVDEDFAFFGKVLDGKAEQSPRWKLCVNSVTANLGEPLGEAYIKVKFSEDSKKQTLAMVENIHKAVAANFQAVDWMDEATREKALEKLSLITKKIGYPDQWQDYSSLSTDRSSYFQNQLRANAYATRFQLSKIGKTSDKTEWGMPPQMVNAYYEPTMNEIVFPAAILQPPFYDVTSPLAWNYGGIGMVIGHETTHAFDDEGRHFDGQGNLKDWWTPQAADAFTQRTDCLVKQFDAYTVSGGVHLSGKLTLGENIADLGGLKLSYAAFQQAKQGQPPAPVVAGFNENQQYFVSFAQGWCTKETPEFEQLHAKTNPHADPRHRVNGVLVNIPQFAEVFGCKTQSPMAPANHCQVW